MLYVDPWTGPASLKRLSFFRSADLVRFLTSKVQDPDGTMAVRLEAFRDYCPNVKMRQLSSKELHSRYVRGGPERAAGTAVGLAY